MARLGIGRDRPVGEAVRLAYPDMCNSLRSRVAGQRRFLPSYSLSTKSDRTRRRFHSKPAIDAHPKPTPAPACRWAALELGTTPPTGRLVVGQRGHRAMPVAPTVWSAVTNSVGLVRCCFQRYRTGAFDSVQASDISLRPDHTKHRHSGSQSTQQSTPPLRSESYGADTGCATLLMPALVA